MTPPADGQGSPTSVARRQKRGFAACNRCRSQKTKCDGEKPCRGCIRSGKPSECTYPVRSKKINVLERSLDAAASPVLPDSLISDGVADALCSYVHQLQADNAELRKALAAAAPPTTFERPPSAAASTNVDNTSPMRTAADASTVDVVNPLLEQRVLTEGNSFVGGATCVAFATRLASSVRDTQTTLGPLHPVKPVFRHPILRRSLNKQPDLPNKAYAQMLVQVVLRFIGSDYHLLRKSYVSRIDSFYASTDIIPLSSYCRFFAILALGELWLKKTGTLDDGERVIPGTHFFLQAVSLFQEEYEEPSIEYIEALLALCFYSFALNRKSTAFVYAGIALRTSQTMGLHRNVIFESDCSPAEIENRRRVWWTVYIFDRLASSKLGHSTINDCDIDVPLPSYDNLSATERDDFFEPTQLIANIKLSRITGSILGLIYAGPIQRAPGDIVRNVHTILNDLKHLDAELPRELRLDHKRFPAFGSRSVASLRLHFNQNIILTTRPVLLYVFKYNLKLFRSGVSAVPEARELNPMTIALSEACIYAARASANLLGQLWMSGNISTFGYFDAHYTYSATLVLLISQVLRPNDHDKDAIELSCSLLQSMVDDGNLPALELAGRLSALQKDFENLEEPHARECGIMSRSMRGYITSTGTFAAHVNRDHPYSSSRPPVQNSSLSNTSTSHKSVDLDLGERTSCTTAPLDVPFLKGFLDDAGFQNDEDNDWALAWDDIDFERHPEMDVE